MSEQLKCPGCGITVYLLRSSPGDFFPKFSHDMLKCQLAKLNLGEISQAIMAEKSQQEELLAEMKQPKEDQIRQLMQELAYYAEDGVLYDPAGAYLCGSCLLRIPAKEGEDRGGCLWVQSGTSGISMSTGSCDIYKHGREPGGEELDLGDKKWSQVDAGYSERPEEKSFGCGHCEYGGEAEKEDKDGRKGHCSYFQVHIEPKACCRRHDGPDMVVAPGEKKDDSGDGK